MKYINFGDKWRLYSGNIVCRCYNDGTKSNELFGVVPVTYCESGQEGYMIRSDP